MPMGVISMNWEKGSKRLGIGTWIGIWIGRCTMTGIWIKGLGIGTGLRIGLDIRYKDIDRDTGWGQG